MGRESKIKFMCLACGRFWWADKGSMEWAKSCCPYCRDLFYTDNIVPNIPEPAYTVEDFITFDCGHEIGFDTVGDAVCCPVCKTDIVIPEELKQKTLQNWQNEILTKEGI